jgi:hypothetical protein
MAHDTPFTAGLNLAHEIIVSIVLAVPRRCFVAPWFESRFGNGLIPT